MKRLKKEKVLGFLKEMLNSAKVYCPQFRADKDLMLLPLGEGVFKGEIGKMLRLCSKLLASGAASSISR